MAKLKDGAEGQRDTAIEKAFRKQPAFANWFLGKTRFASRRASCVWSRSDHPWTAVEFDAPESGETMKRDGETDVLVVFEDEAGERFALHIENKRADGSFTKYQTLMYPARAQKWLGNPKYGNYTEFQTVLISPRSFYNKNEADCRSFDSFVAYEEIAEFVPIFAT